MYFVARAVQTNVANRVKIVVWRAFYTLFSIEIRILFWAINTFFQLQIIHEPRWARLTGFAWKVKIFWEKARNTVFIVPKVAIRALTSFGSRVKLLCLGASLAVFGSLIEKLGSGTSSTLLSIKQGPGCRAVNTFFIGWIINHLIVTENALLFVQIKVFRHEACDTVIIVPESSKRAFTCALHHHLSAFATLALLACFIP